MKRWVGTGLVAGFVCAGAAALPAAAGESRRIELFGERGGGRLGVSLEDVASEDAAKQGLAGERGARVKDVHAGSPAEKAGIEQGDVIVRFDGESVRSVRQLARLVRETPPGRKVEVEVSRAGATQKLSATIEEGRRRAMFGDFGLGDGDLEIQLPEPPEPPEPPAPPALSRMPRFRWDGGKLRTLSLIDRGPRKLGIQYQEISGQLARYFKLDGDAGVLVTEVDADGPAGKAGLKAGDVVVKAGGDVVRDGGDLRDALSRAEPGSELKLTVQRDGKPTELGVKVGGEKTKARRRGETT
jgi:serine protease Do